MNELKNSFNLWYHHEKDDWSIDGFKNIYKIKTGIDFWKLYNNWDLIWWFII